MESKEITNTGDLISLELTNDDLQIFTGSTYLSLDVRDDMKQFINTTEVLGYELKDYDERQLIYRIVLEFFNETGNVF
jgi:hypothetical protein